QAHEATARRLYIAHARGQRGEFVQRVAELVERERLHVELDVGPLARRIGAREQPELRGRHGERAAAEQRVVEPHAGAANRRTIDLVERFGAFNPIDEPQLQVILQVLADAGLVEHDGNAELPELVRGADAGEFEDLHRANRAGRENDFAADARGSPRAVLAPVYGDGTPFLKLDPLDQAVELEAQVGALEHRREAGARPRPAPPALLVDVENAAALVVAGVEIGDALDARLLRRRAERVEDVPAHARRLDAQLAADRVCLARPEKMVLVAPEERQHVVGAPANEPELAPVVVVRGLPAHVDHG